MSYKFSRFNFLINFSCFISNELIVGIGKGLSNFGLCEVRKHCAIFNLHDVKLNLWSFPVFQFFVVWQNQHLCKED